MICLSFLNVKVTFRMKMLTAPPHPLAELLLESTVKIINCAIQNARPKCCPWRQPYVTLCKGTLVAMAQVSRQKNKDKQLVVDKIVIDNTKLQQMLEDAKKSSTVCSNTYREWYVVPICLSCGDISHSQLLLVSNITRGDVHYVYVDPNGQSYSFADIIVEDNTEPQEVFIRNNQLRIQDAHTRLLLENLKLTCSKVVIPCSSKFDHTSCWLLSTALLAKIFLTAKDYKSIGLPSKIGKQKHLDKIIPAILTNSERITQKRLYLVGQPHPRKIKIRYGQPSTPPKKKIRHQ
jgi:hypothetical protein